MGGSNMSRTGKLLQYINYRMRVTVTDGGLLLCRCVVRSRGFGGFLGF